MTPIDLAIDLARVKLFAIATLAGTVGHRQVVDLGRVDGITLAALCSLGGSTAYENEGLASVTAVIEGVRVRGWMWKVEVLPRGAA